MSAVPFLTDATTKSPTPATSILLLTPLNPFTEMISISRAPVLSTHWSLAQIGNALDTFEVNGFIIITLL
jgi:hypothetical protein